MEKMPKELAHDLVESLTDVLAVAILETYYYLLAWQSLSYLFIRIQIKSSFYVPLQGGLKVSAILGHPIFARCKIKR